MLSQIETENKQNFGEFDATVTVSQLLTTQNVDDAAFAAFKLQMPDILGQLGKTLDTQDKFPSSAFFDKNAASVDGWVKSREDMLERMKSVGGNELADTRKHFGDFFEAESDPKRV